MHVKVFISHKSEDKPFVEALVRDLQDNGVDVWFDKDDIRTGQRWADEVFQGLKDSSHIVIVLSPASVAAPVVNLELRVAMQYGLEILPLQLYPGWQTSLLSDEDFAEHPVIKADLQEFLVKNNLQNLPNHQAILDFLKMTQYIDFSVSYDLGWLKVLQYFGIEGKFIIDEFLENLLKEIATGYWHDVAPKVRKIGEWGKWSGFIALKQMMSRVTDARIQWMIAMSIAETPFTSNALVIFEDMLTQRPGLCRIGLFALAQHIQRMRRSADHVINERLRAIFEEKLNDDDPYIRHAAAEALAIIAEPYRLINPPEIDLPKLLPDFDTSEGNLNQRVLEDYPYIIAYYYEKVLQDGEAQVRFAWVLKCTMACLQVVAVLALSDYLNRAEEFVALGGQLRRILKNRLPDMTYLSTWTMIATRLLAFYEQHDLQLPIPETHELTDRLETLTQPLIALEADSDPKKGVFDYAKHLDEAHGHLVELLDAFNFLSNYTIFGLDELDDIHYLKIYRGATTYLHPVSEKYSLLPELELNELFLSNMDENWYLPIHPWILGTLEKVRMGDPDMLYRKSIDSGVYMRSVEDVVMYILFPVADEHRIADNRLSVSVQAKLAKLDVDKKLPVSLIPEEFANDLRTRSLDNASATTEDENSDAYKYNSKLYLQRADLYATFEAFRDDEKQILAITGRTGVGKSSFLLSLLDHSAWGDDVFALYLDASKLVRGSDEIDSSLKSMLFREIFADQAKNLESHEYYIVLDRIREGLTDNGKFFLLVDAINESANPLQLLQEIDSLADYLSKANIRQIKIVFTSRPETWQRILNGPAEKVISRHLYYRVNPRDLTVELKRFSNDELPQVYAKYKEAYKVGTELDALHPRLQAELLDPIQLRLVMEMHAGESISLDFDTNEIQRKYVARLMKDKRLDEEAEYFINDYLLPFMLDPNGKLSRIANSEEIRDANLHRYFKDTGRDKDGRQTNQAYVDLRNVGILDEIPGERGVFFVGFRYESFFDFYGGQYLYKQLSTDDHRAQQYKKLIAQITVNPWLWGIMVQALIEELKKGQEGLIESVAKSEDAEVHKVLVAALEYYGRQHRNAVVSILEQLLDVAKMPTLSMRRTAIQVAYRLRIMHVFEKGIWDQDVELRTFATQLIWQVFLHPDPNPVDQIRSEVFEILERQTKRIRRIIMDRERERFFDTLIFLSLMIIFKFYKNKLVISQLKDVWRPAFEKLYIIKRSGHLSLGYRLLHLIIPRLLSLFILPRLVRKALGKMLEDSGELDHWLNLAELSEYFGLKQETRTHIAQLAKLLGASTDRLLEARDDLIALAHNRTILTLYLASAVFTYHIIRDPERTIPLMFEVVEEGYKPEKPTFFTQLASGPYLFLNTKDLENHPEWLEIYRKYYLRHWTENNVQFHTNLNSYRFLGLLNYVAAYYDVHKGLDEELITQLLEDCRKDLDRYGKEAKKFYDYAKEVPPIVRYDVLNVEQALGILRGSGSFPNVEETLRQVLSEIFYIDERAVERFMLQEDLSHELKEQVRKSDIPTLTHIASNYATQFGFEVFADDAQPKSVEFIHRLFDNAAHSRNINQWAGRVIRLLLEYNDSIFNE